MTTEILRNLIYEDPGRLDLVRYVVLDEVHYIDDFPRGSVWEEIVIQAPRSIKLVGLSATIGNYREIAEWMAENRGGMETVFHNVRPVELKMWLAVQNRFFPLFKEDGGIDQRTWSKAAEEEEASYRVGRFTRLPSNDLLKVIEELRRLDILPSIYFIFSRRGCREALQRCAYHELDLTTPAEKEAIDRAAAERLLGLKDRDEETLFTRMVDSRLLRRGLAEHHAGLLPYHKEMVEELFQRGLIKVVFATETLSLGINMPARGVVVSSFTKFDGVNFSNLTTGELTQLMGRAGRRGIDVIGHGVILKESDIEIGAIYEVAMGPTLVVESKFLPSYNMALNLLRVYTPEEAEGLMERSFGQFQKRLAADRTQERLQNVRARLEDIRRMWDDSEVSIEEVAQYYKLEDRRRAIRIELKRLRRDAGAERRSRRGRHTRAQGHSNKLVQKLEIEAKGLLERQRKLKVVRSPRFGEHLRRYGELRALERELDAGEREATGQMDEYARKLRRLSPMPANVDIGDAIKAMKSLYSLLRQLEFALRQAKSPLLDVVTRAVAQMERDVIKRT